MSVSNRSEANIQNDILVELSKAGCMVWRQNTGAYRDPKTDRLIRYGLCVGSSDIIGICPDGVFLAVEVKKKTGRATEKQLRFIENINRQGGRAGIARSVSDALEIIKGEKLAG